jgi:hypothetical protein
MIARYPQTAWSIDVPVWLDDHARDALSDDLQLTFHSVDASHAYTIAHRFLEAGSDTLLRIVQSAPKHYAVQLVGFGSHVPADTAAEMELAVTRALERLSPRQPLPEHEDPVPMPLSARLRQLADGLASPLIIPARLRPIQVLGRGEQAHAGPIELVLGPGAQQHVGSAIRTRAIFDAGMLTVWLSGDWPRVQPSMLVLYAIDSDEQVTSARAPIEADSRRVRVDLPWPHPEPPTEVLIAVMAVE